MRNITAKTDNTGDTLTADEFNANLRTEIQAVVTDTGQTLDPEAGPDTDQDMLGKALAYYASDGGFYQDSGAADAYVLGRVGNIQPVPAYFDGQQIVFVAGNTNTGASTVNVTTLGSKDFRRPGGAVLSADDIVAGQYVVGRFDSGNDYFEFLGSVAPIKQRFVSTGQAIVAGTEVVLPHGLGVEPDIIQFVLECISAEGGYSVGDRVSVGYNSSDSGNTRMSLTVLIDNVNITVKYSISVGVFSFRQKTVVGNFVIDDTKWELYVKALA